MHATPDAGMLMQMLFSTLAPQAPMFLVNVAALILVIARRRQLQRAFAWALLGVGLMLLASAVMPVVFALVNYAQMRGGLQGPRVATLYTMLGFLWSLWAAAGWALVLTAVFAGRPKPVG